MPLMGCHVLCRFALVTANCYFCVFILGGEPEHLLNTAGEWFLLKLTAFVFSWWEVFSVRIFLWQVAKCLGTNVLIAYFSESRRGH